MKRTQMIGPLELTLEVGKWYRAESPIGETVVEIKDGANQTVVTIDSLTYEESGLFLAEFNGGITPWDGRVW